MSWAGTDGRADKLWVALLRVAVLRQTQYRLDHLRVGVWVLVLGFEVWVLGFGVWGLKFGVWGLGLRLWGLGFRV